MKPISSSVDLPQLEEAVLKKWSEQKTFAAQETLRENAKEFSFYDGPPFANGLPHYGHLLANTIKDVVPRYWIMKGFKVKRRFGWDCHGLPVEVEIEKTHNLKGRPDILKMGVKAFNEACRSSVMHYTKEWQKTIQRLGRWVDWDDQYRTMDRDYMESVWWVFSELYKKGLIYSDYKVVAYSPRTTSVVANFEANQNYKEVQDPSVTVKFKARGEDFYFLAWTTTPWTLPSNLALCVGEEIEYVKIRDHKSKETWVLAKACLANLYSSKNEEGGYEVLDNFPGKDLQNLEYEPLFSYFAGHDNAFRVLLADYVTTESGTGVVHQAPAFGEDDYRTCRANGIELVDPVDESGHFTSLVPDYQGLYIKDADKAICSDLKARGALIRHSTIVHSYPFDERTNTPLIYKAVPSWYVAVEKLVPKLVANNQQVNWVPGHIKDGRMGTWLKGARDWAISRNRFWGTPLPVWACSDCESTWVASSVSDLEERAERRFSDIHKHILSDVELPCTACAGTMTITDAVFDCWFESGSMPYAQLHYPFENKAHFESVFPADFIAEGLDQTRGWFYTLSVLSAALFDRPAFKNVIVNGLILGKNGKKMSKRLRNYTPPGELIDSYGADSVRLFMINSQLVRGEDLIFTDKGVRDIARLVLLPLWNALSFFTTYASAESWKPDFGLIQTRQPKSENELDQWLLSKLQSLIVDVDTHMKSYKLYLVVPRVLAFVEDLTNWYIRLSRRRFWGEGNSQGQMSSDQNAAFETLYYALVQFSKVLAPFAPFISERIFGLLTDDANGDVASSVHLCDFPEVLSELKNSDLETKIENVRLAVNLGRSLRQQHGLKVRQALRSMTVVSADRTTLEAIKGGVSLLQKELNVKEVKFAENEAEHVELALKPNLPVLGKRLGRELSKVRNFLSELNQNQNKIATFLAEIGSAQGSSIGGHKVELGDFLVERRARQESVVATERGLQSY